MGNPFTDPFLRGLGMPPQSQTTAIGAPGQDPDAELANLISQGPPPGWTPEQPPSFWEEPGPPQPQGGLQGFLPSGILEQMGVAPPPQAEETTAKEGPANPNLVAPSITSSPKQLLPGTAKTARQATLQQAAQAEQGIQAQANQVAATAQSQFEQEDAGIAATEASVAKEGEAVAQRTKDRAEAINTANVKLAAAEMRADDLANKEPDPGRLWDNMEGWRKATFGLSMLANALANSRDTNHTNAITAQLMGMVKDDVAQQTARMDRQRQRVKDGIATLKEQKAEGLATVEDTYTSTMTRITALDRVAQAKAKTAGRGSKLEAAYQGLRSKLAEARQEISAQEHGRLAGAEAQARGFAHAERMARVEADAQVEAAKLKAASEAAKLKADADAKKGETDKDLRFVPSDSGLRLITGRDDKNNPIVMDPKQAKLHKDYVEKATSTVVTANQLDADLSQLTKLLADENNWDAIAHGDGAVNSKVIELGRRIATNRSFNEGGRTAKDDVDMALDMVTGMPAKGNTLSAVTNIADRMTMMKAALDGYHARLPESTNRALKTYPLPDGGNLEWLPPVPKQDPADEDPYLLPGEKEARTSQSISADAGVSLDRPAVPPVPALEGAGFGKPPKDPAAQEVTDKLPMTPEQIRTVESAKSQADGTTARRHMELVNAKLHQDTVAEQAKLEKAAEKDPALAAGLEVAKAIVLKRERDAAFRYARANEAELDAARKRELEVARELAGFNVRGPLGAANTGSSRDIDEPSTEATLAALRDRKFVPGKLSPEDIARVKQLAVRIAKNPQVVIGDTVTTAGKP